MRTNGDVCSSVACQHSSHVVTVLVFLRLNTDEYLEAVGVSCDFHVNVYE